MNVCWHQIWSDLWKVKMSSVISNPPVCFPVPKPLVELHVKLLRKLGRSVSSDRWEKYLAKVRVLCTVYVFGAATENFPLPLVCYTCCAQHLEDGHMKEYEGWQLSLETKILWKLAWMQWPYLIIVSCRFARSWTTPGHGSWNRKATRRCPWSANQAFSKYDTVFN